MLPPEFRRRQRAYLTVVPGAVLPPDAPAAESRVGGYVQEQGRVEEAAARRELGPGAQRSVERLVRRGILQRQWELEPPRVRAKFVEHLGLELPEYQRQEVVTQLQRSRAPRQVAILEALALAGQPQPASYLRRQFGPGAVKALLAKGYLSQHRVRQQRDPLAGETFPQEAPLTLTVEQGRALKAITGHLDVEGGPKTFLLWGVTGSGKTEVYLQAIARCVARGRRAIVLVPEISLTPQMVRRFAARFPGRVALLHSGLSLGEQFDQWWRIREGQYDVVIGSRGALFAPQPDLGLIVIDEEHEWTYKQQEQGPLYHARETATRLAELTGAGVVLGSATPDVVTYHRAQGGQYHLLELPYRVGAGDGEGLPMAQVEVVNMRRELREGNRSIFSRSLQEALGSCLEGGHQGILFLNRRGTAGSVQCRSCGFTLRCRRCALTLTYHSVGERLVCHRCNRRSRVPSTCPRCMSPRIRFLGLGTQRVVEEVQRRFPGARILRWDRDAITHRRAHQEITRKFQEGETDLLVGTQMLTKGLHFPGVTLVGVLLADLGLNVPDFRAGERVFQVLCQVAGRAGRGALPGQVVVQTYNPEHYAIRHAAAQDYEGFYHQEMEYRRQELSPPFSRLVRLVYQDSSEGRCQSQSQALARSLARTRDARGEVVDILGPAPAYPARVPGRYRWHLVLRGAQPAALLEGLELPQGWTVDVDPQTTA